MEGGCELGGYLGKSIPEEENSKCKGPGAGMCMACLKKSTEACSAGEK